MSSELESLRQRTSPDCLSDLQLDQIVAGEAGEQAAWEHHLAGCRGCAARLEARQSAFESFPDQLDLSTLSAVTVERVDSAGKTESRFGWRRWLMVVAPAAAAALLILLVVLPQKPRDTVRIKGKASFSLVVNRSGKQFVGESGGHYFAGDRLRFRISSENPVHLAVFDLESTGAVSCFLPVRGEASLEMPAGKQMLLEDTIELDRSTGEEILVGLFCPSRFDPGQAEELLAGWDRKAESLAHLAGSLGPGCSAQRFLMNKQERSP
jgi:hypothetical protein